jgi:pilus assembly protein CpaB
VGALLLIRGFGARQAEQTAAEAEQIAGQQVLVAARDIPQGAALAPSDLAVALFPTSSVAPSFVRLDQQPSAQADFVGGVTRRAFVQGEPIVSASVVAAASWPRNLSLASAPWPSKSRKSPLPAASFNRTTTSTSS